MTSLWEAIKSLLLLVPRIKRKCVDDTIKPENSMTMQCNNLKSRFEIVNVK
jgi:hypothetical protein